MNWVLIADIVYVIILILVCLRIIYDTNNISKTLAYLLLSILVPVAGMLIYFIFGINYRKRIVYGKKIFQDEDLRQRLVNRIISNTETNLALNTAIIREGKSLVHLLLNDSLSPLTSGNQVKLLINGEEKFPEVVSALRAARHHIHIEYYIYENGVIGNQIKDILIEKAREGVEVRFIYDDFGSRTIRGKFIRALRYAGVEVYPFNKVRFVLLANRINYRNHRKIIIVDGCCAFVGGINISDRYVNSGNGDARNIYWRDSHLRIDGPGMHYLQYIFFSDWNFCSGQNIQPGQIYFNGQAQRKGNVNVQIAASGPDSPRATIMLSLLKAISLAKREILITTPYFIPGENILNALVVAALSGVSIKILVPGISDSALVNAAAWSFYDDLLLAGVKIFLYRKGFMHAKTMVIDGHITVLGTANMDYRSFDLNFEVNAIVYDEAFGSKMRAVFENDLADANIISVDAWNRRPLLKRFAERVARLLSPLL